MVHRRGDNGAGDGEEGSLGVAWTQQTAVE